MRFFRQLTATAVSASFAASMAGFYSANAVTLEEPLDIHLAIETKTVDLADLPENRVVSLEMSMENCPPIAGMWVYFEKDARLAFKEVMPFSVVEGVENIMSTFNTTAYPEKEPNKMGCGISAEYGSFLEHSGAVITINVIIPEDAKNGDFYPVNFSRYLVESQMVVDFSDEFSDRYGESAFTELQNGGIYIVKSSHVKGDADGDGEITLNDAYSVLMESSRIAIGQKEQFSPKLKDACDIDHDGAITLNDAYCILMYSSYQSIGKNPSWEEIVK